MIEISYFLELLLQSVLLWIWF